MPPMYNQKRSGLCPYDRTRPFSTIRFFKGRCHYCYAFIEHLGLYLTEDLNAVERIQNFSTTALRCERLRMRHLMMLGNYVHLEVVAEKLSSSPTSIIEFSGPYRNAGM